MRAITSQHRLNGWSEKTWNPYSDEPYDPTSNGPGATPIIEHVFYDNSFGFRPHRGAQDAIAKVDDLDLKAYFDNVNYDLIIKCLQQYIADKWTLRLIRKFLTMDYAFARNERGTPQSGSLSPLLANVYLNELDKELTKRNRDVSLTKIFEEIHQKMRGWLQYYSIGKLIGFIH